MKQDLDLILEGNVITMVNQKPRARAIGIKDGRIAVVGSLNEVKKREGNSTKFIDQKDKTILPGFIDTHMHPVFTGRVKLGVDLSDVKSLDETIEKIKDRVKITPPGKWILCYRFNRMLIKEKRFPTIKELDAISTRHPINIQHYDLHFSIVNSMAYKLFNISIGLEGVHKNLKGEPTGLIEDPLSADIMRKVEDLSDENDRLKAVIAATQEALKVGITTLHMKEDPHNVKLIIKNKDHIHIRIKPLILLHPMRLENLDEIISSDILRDETCIAIISDGSIEARTGAFFEPYTDDLTTLGMLYYSDEELRHFLEKAHQAGFQISVHCEGDRSIEQVLSMYEEVLKKYPRDDHRHRIEHFEIPTLEQIKRAAKVGITLAMQPMFIPVAEGSNLEIYRKFLGEERTRRSNPFRSILNEGILVAGGSDSPVTLMNPLAGIQACLTHPNKDQRITLNEAIRLYTINGAKIGFEEKEKGTIEEGKLADFVLLSEDPYRVSPEKIRDINIEMTIIEGKVVYGREK